MSRLPQHIKSSIETHDGAKATVRLLFEKTQEQEYEITSIKASLTATQNELENWRTKFHDSDKQNGILDARLQTTVVSEIFKFLISTVVAGIGINLFTDGKQAFGSALIFVSVTLYIGITFIGRTRA